MANKNWINSLTKGEKVYISTKGDIVFEVTDKGEEIFDPYLGTMYRLRLTNTNNGKYHDDYVREDGISVYYKRHLIQVVEIDIGSNI